MYYSLYLTVNEDIEEKIQTALLIILFPYLIFFKPLSFNNFWLKLD